MDVSVSVSLFQDELASTVELAVKAALDSVVCAITEAIRGKFTEFQVEMSGLKRENESLKLRLEISESELKAVRGCINAADADIKQPFIFPDEDVPEQECVPIKEEFIEQECVSIAEELPSENNVCTLEENNKLVLNLCDDSPSECQLGFRASKVDEGEHDSTPSPQCKNSSSGKPQCKKHRETTPQEDGSQGQAHQPHTAAPGDSELGGSAKAESHLGQGEPSCSGKAEDVSTGSHAGAVAVLTPDAPSEPTGAAETALVAGQEIEEATLESEPAEGAVVCGLNTDNSSQLHSNTNTSTDQCFALTGAQKNNE
ncbi:UNVERIFIED_CONTAM: hypothetical protein FKN15_047492 [Acipenser sinensis]